MADLDVKLGTLNTEVYPHRLPSGTADRAINVVVSAGDVTRRAGFAEFEDDVNGAGGAIKALFTAAFSDGDVYVIAKCADAKLYQRKVYPADAGSFTAITSGTTHNAADAGWSFMWGDRFHYFDRGGGSRWSPDVNSGTAYKAGIGRPTNGAAGSAAAGGEKDGFYHVHVAYRNSTTGEESVVTAAQSPPIECDVDDNTGGISITNWSTIKAADTTYEWDQVVFYTTYGTTEWIGRSDGNGLECYSYRAYVDAVVAKSSGSAALNKADHVLNPHEHMRNQGGEPPKSRFGCWTGSQAVYGGIYVSTTLIGGKIMYSVPNFPTMVPQVASYSVGGDSKSLWPKPWVGEIVGGMPGNMNAMAHGGGVTMVFTPTSMYRLVRAPDGRMFPVVAHSAVGSVGELSVVGTPSGVYVLGQNSLMRVSTAGIEELSRYVITPALELVPSAYRASSVMGYFSAGRQVWCAMVPSGGTKAQDILIYDERERGFYQFRPACLGTRAALTTAFANDDSNVTFTAERPGAPGNVVKVAATDTASKGHEKASVSGSTITVEVQTGIGGTTATELVAAFNKCGDAVALASAAVKSGDDGSGVVDTLTATALTGGTGDEGIVSLCELAVPNAAPVMLVATDGGRILKYPSGTDDDGEDYAALHRSYWGQERWRYDQVLNGVRIAAGSNAASNVRVGVRGLQLAGQTGSEQVATVLNQSLREHRGGVEFGSPNASLFQVEFFSPQSVTASWAVRDVAMSLLRT